MTSARSGRSATTTFTSSPIRRPSIACIPATTTFRSRQRRLDDLLAAECQQLAREPRATRARLLNFCDVGVTRIVRAEIGQQQLAEAQDDRQQVVEVVRHAAGQASDGFHLLQLLVLRLQRAAFGDVLVDAHAAHRFAVLAEQDAAGAAQPPDACRRAEWRGARRRNRAPDGSRSPIVSTHERAIVGVDEIDERLESPAKRPRPQAELGFENLGPSRRRRWRSPGPRSRRWRSAGRTASALPCLAAPPRRRFVR